MSCVGAPLHHLQLLQPVSERWMRRAEFGEHIHKVTVRDEAMPEIEGCGSRYRQADVYTSSDPGRGRPGSGGSFLLSPDG